MKIEGDRMLQVFCLLNGVTIEIECCDIMMRMMHIGFLCEAGASQDMQSWQIRCDQLGQSHSRGRVSTF